MDGELQTVDRICSRCGASFKGERAIVPVGLPATLAAACERFLAAAALHAACPACKKAHQPASVKHEPAPSPAKPQREYRRPYADN